MGPCYNNYTETGSFATLPRGGNRPRETLVVLLVAPLDQVLAREKGTRGIRERVTARIFPNEGSFSQVPKDWELWLGVVGDVFFQYCRKFWIGSVLELLEMLL